MPMPWRFWQSEEGRRYLKEFIEGRPAEAIAKELGCTADAVRDAHRTYLGKVPPRTRWKTEEGRRLLGLLQNAPKEESYRAAISEAIEATGLAEEVILRAYKLNVSGRPPGKPRRKKTLMEWVEENPQEAYEAVPTTRTEALQDALYAARMQGAAPDGRQPVVRVIFEFYQPHGRVTIRGHGIHFAGPDIDPETPEIVLTALPAEGDLTAEVREVTRNAGDTQAP